MYHKPIFISSAYNYNNNPRLKTCIGIHKKKRFPSRSINCFCSYLQTLQCSFLFKNWRYMTSPISLCNNVQRRQIKMYKFLKFFLFKINLNKKRHIYMNEYAYIISRIEVLVIRNPLATATYPYVVSFN